VSVSIFFDLPYIFSFPFFFIIFFFFLFPSDEDEEESDIVSEEESTELLKTRDSSSWNLCPHFLELLKWIQIHT